MRPEMMKAGAGLFARYRPARVAVTAVFLLLLLTGCGGPMLWKWKVSRFHTLGDVREKTFTIMPLRAEFNNSLEFMSYAKRIAEKLGTYGMIYRSQTELGKTDYLVALDYGIGQPVTRHFSYPVYGQTGGGTGTFSGTAWGGGTPTNVSGTYKTPATYGVVGTGSGTETVYDRYVQIHVYEGKFTGDVPLKRFEGRALSTGTTNDPALVVPAGIHAILREFPGKDGATSDAIFSALGD